MKHIAVRSFQLLALTAGIAACSAAQPGAKAPEPCVLAGEDSVFARTGPVYLACAVDRVARVKQSRMQSAGAPSTSRPQPGETCLTAEARFVVGADGMPEPGTVRILDSNDSNLAESLRISIPGWRYEPAQLGGRPVRQLVTERKAVVQMVTVSTSRGAAPPRRPSSLSCR